MGKTSKMLSKAGYSLDGQPTTAPETLSAEVENSVEENSVAEMAERTEEERIEKDRSAADRVIPLRSSQPAEVPSPEWDERLNKVVGFTTRTAESFRVLRSKILLPQDGTPPPRTIMVTSALPREGKSFVSANLGIALAQGMDQHALLVDCDLRAPALAQLFGLSWDRGLAEYLQYGVDLSSLLQKTSMEKLSILPSGSPPVNPAELLGSSRMLNLVEEMAIRYPDRYVIFDTPPLEVASETHVLSQAVDGVVLVVREGVSNKALIEKFIVDIGKDKIIGVIFNGHKTNFISTRLVDKSHYYYGDYYKQTN